MNVKISNQVESVNEYYNKSSYGYKYLLWGYQHFGYHPLGKKIQEKEAVVLMQDKVGEKLKIKNGWRVLDAGCARGLAAIHFSKKFGCKIDGVDVNPLLIAGANKNAERLKAKGETKFCMMDYSNLDFAEEDFDAVYTMETLCHSPDVGKTLREFHRILKNKGKIALLEYTFEQDNKFSAYELNILEKLMRATATTQMKNFRHNTFQKIIEGAGFNKIQCEDVSKNVMPSLYRFKKMAFVPYNIIKPFKLQEKFPNLTIAIEWTKMVEKGLIRHNIFTAKK